MMSKLKPYAAYKDSGVPWLGQVPEHWEVHAQRDTLFAITQALRRTTLIRAA